MVLLQLMEQEKLFEFPSRFDFPTLETLTNNFVWQTPNSPPQTFKPTFPQSPDNSLYSQGFSFGKRAGLTPFARRRRLITLRRVSRGTHGVTGLNIRCLDSGLL